MEGIENLGSKLNTEENNKNEQFKNWQKNITIFLTSQAISLFGSSLVQYAIIWYITLQTKSGVMTTIATICGFLPQILISVFAGVWADRYNKKTLIAVSDTCIALSTLVVAIVFLAGFDYIWLLFIALGIRSLGGGVQTPAINSFIPELVPEDKLMKVNGINTTIQSVMLILSPAAGGALMGMLPIGRIFFIDVITALIGVGILLTIKLPKKEKQKDLEKPDYYKDIKEGLVYIKEHTFIKAFMKYYAILTVLISPIALLTPLLVARSFGEEVWRLTANEIVFFIGSIIGGALVSVWGGFKNKIHTIAFATFLTGVFSIALGLAPSFMWYLVCMGILGIGMIFFNSPSVVILQETVEQSIQGRIFSIVQIIGSGIMPLSMLVYGPLSDRIKIEWIIIGASVLLMALGIAMVYDRNIKEYKVVEEIREEG